MLVCFIQDAIQFPNLIYIAKAEPDPATYCISSLETLL